MFPVSIRRSSFAMIIAAAAGTLGTVHMAAAANSINWQAPINMLGNLDVSNVGTAFDALTATNIALPAINGVTFTNATIANNVASTSHISVAFGDNHGAFGAPFSTTPPSSQNYSDLVNTGVFGENSDIVTISGLTLNDTYQVQSWSYYTGDSPTATTSYDGADTVALDTSVGQYAIGTFTALTSNETYDYFTGGGHNFINDVSVRDLTVASGGGGGGTSVPEPASLGLIGLTSLLGLRRSRRMA